MVNIHPRSEWGAHSYTGPTYTWPDDQRTEFFVHYEGGYPTRDTGVQAMKDIEAGHLANGWVGIGYNFVVMQDGSIWEGRGWSLVGAHCPNHNRLGWGVQVHVGGDQQPTDDALRSVCDLYTAAVARAGHSLMRKGHQDGWATDCPGKILEHWVKAGMPRPGGGVTPPWKPPTVKPGVPAPRYPLASNEYFGPKSGPANSISGYYSHRGDLQVAMRRFIERGWDLGPTGADGFYGPYLEGATRGFQREKGLTVDGLIGPQTWGTLWTAPITKG